MKIHWHLSAGLRMAQRTLLPFDFPLNRSDHLFGVKFLYILVSILLLYSL